MANPTNPRPQRFVRRTGRDVWTTRGPLAYLESIQAAGSVAAPLLAGASFTLVALVLQSPKPFGRWQDVSLLLFVAAGLAQIFAVQSVIWTRRYMVTPDELKQWFPDDFTDHGERPTQWLQLLQRYNDERARRWAGRTRAWINAGITLLLAGIAVGVVPPGPVSSVRWLVITVAWIGVAVEASWVAAMALDERARLGMLMRSGRSSPRVAPSSLRLCRRRRSDWAGQPPGGRSGLRSRRFRSGLRPAWTPVSGRAGCGWGLRCAGHGDRPSGARARRPGGLRLGPVVRHRRICEGPSPDASGTASWRRRAAAQGREPRRAPPGLEPVLGTAGRHQGRSGRAAGRVESAARARAGSLNQPGSGQDCPIARLRRPSHRSGR